jgi:mannose-6-phosphate isomerase
MNALYPLKFKPIFREKIWGGTRIRTKLGLDFAPLKNCGEAWMVSGVPGFGTKVVNGFLKGNELNELLEIYMDDLVGEKAFEKNADEFPILVKFIDSDQYLSVQVHPDDRLAMKRGLSSGKTEMWYILEAEKDAEMITGFSRPVDQKTYLQYLRENKLVELLNVEKVRAEDVFYIPSGRVHAMGPGILLAEIQQTSDTTYRIYDWDRVDSDGKSRELHTDLALEAIDFGIPDSYRTPYKKVQNKTSNLVDSPYFVTNLVDFTSPIRKDYTQLDSFVIYLCTAGECTVDDGSRKEHLKMGETMLIPAIMEKILLEPNPECKILEVYVP